METYNFRMHLRDIAIGLVIAAVCIAAVAFGQTRPITPDLVVVDGAQQSFLADGGCTFTAQGALADGLSVPANAYAFNGARCATVRTAALKAAVTDAKINDGGVP